MNEETKQTIVRLERVADHTFARAEKKLLSGEELSILELSMLIDIAKDSAKLMKYSVEMKRHYEHHSEKMI